MNTTLVLLHLKSSLQPAGTWKHDFLLWCKPIIVQPWFKIMNAPAERSWSPCIARVCRSSFRLLIWSHEKGKSYPKLSSPTICSGWNQCTSQTGSDCSEMTCISRRRTQPWAGVNSSSHTPPVQCPHPQTLFLPGRDQTEACQAHRQASETAAAWDWPGSEEGMSAPHRYSAYLSGHPNAMMVLSSHHSTNRWVTT